MIKVRDNILQKHFEQAYIEDYSTSYEEKGYEIHLNYPLDDSVICDLAAKKEDELIVFEFKTGVLSEGKLKQIKEVHKKVRSLPNAKFKLVLVQLPKKKDIEIDSLEEEVKEKITDNNLIEEYLANETFDELDKLSTHARVEEISDTEIESVSIKANEINITGSGSISVKLQYGSDSDMDCDNGWAGYDSFPFTFDLTLDHHLHVISLNSIEIDTASF